MLRKWALTTFESFNFQSGTEKCHLLDTKPNVKNNAARANACVEISTNLRDKSRQKEINLKKYRLINRNLRIR